MAPVWSVTAGSSKGGVDVVGVRINVHEDGGKAGAEDAGGCGHVGVGGNEDFGAARQMQAHEGEFEGDAAAVDAEAVGRTLVGGEGLFELVDLAGAQSAPAAAANHFGHGLDIVFLDDGPLGEGFRADGLAAQEGEVTHRRSLLSVTGEAVGEEGGVGDPNVQAHATSDEGGQVTTVPGGFDVDAVLDSKVAVGEVEAG